MRLAALALCCFVLATSPAHADSKSDVGKLIRAHLAATVGTQGALYDTLADDFVLQDASGSYFSLFADCEGDPKASSCESSTPLFGSDWFGTLAYSAIKPIIHVDEAAHVATFFVTGTLTGSLTTQGASVKGKTQMRVAGIAKLGPKGWRIVAAKHSASLPDADLLAHGEVLSGNVFEPKPGLEQEVASWFGHLADHQSAAAIGANGTAPGEVATTAAGMKKLALGWDKLKLEPLSFQVREEGSYAFVDMTVKWTAKKTALTFDMAMVLVKEAGAWKWVAIDFGGIMLTQYSFR